jgi:hypothetical protein
MTGRKQYPDRRCKAMPPGDAGLAMAVPLHDNFYGTVLDSQTALGQTGTEFYAETGVN